MYFPNSRKLILAASFTVVCVEAYVKAVGAEFIS